MKQPIILKIYKNDHLVEVKQYTSDQVIIGHEADVQLDLNDNSVSPIHCLIELRDSGYYLCDLGSATGTQKNGHNVLDEPLSSGDKIQVGVFNIQFFVGAPKAQDISASMSPPPLATPVPPAPPSISTPPAVPSISHVKPPSLSAQKGLAEKPGGKKAKGQKTFAPPSEVKDLKKYLQPTKGSTVEVILSWRERVLGTYHFDSEANVILGPTPNATIQLPGKFLLNPVPFLEIKGGCRILVTSEMTAENVITSQRLEDLIKVGKAARVSSGHTVRLEQGDVICVSLAQGALQIFVRYVPGARKAPLASPFDFTAGEMTGLVVSLVIVALMSIYISVYTPAEVPVVEEEQVRLAQFIYNKPPVKEEPKPEPPPEEKKVEEVPPQKKEPEKVQMAEKPKAPLPKGSETSKAQVSQKQAARASEVRAKPSKVDRPKKFTSIKSGGSVKVGETEGANAPAKDVTKVGLLSAFGGGGVRKELDKAYSGSGDLLGMANSATGKSGQNSDRAGDDIGSKFKDTGAGGKGTATQGIAGIGTKGRGSGMTSYGSGVGLGGKGNVTIDAGGAEEGWEGSIDREAVRRVIKSILSQIKSCYERQLRVNSSLAGKVVIQWEIVAQGKVRTAKTQSTSLNDTTVESCVAARIREARFPEPPAGNVAIVSYPFVFDKQR